jgi:gas vesicle protein
MNTYSETGDYNAAHYSAGSLSAFVFGAAIGAAAALILAPASGRDTRAYLKRRGNEVGRDAMQRGREAWREQSERVKSAVAAGWERAEGAMHQAREHGEEAYREARDSRQMGDPSVVRTGYRSESHRSTE